jgi:hypothetical protein
VDETCAGNVVDRPSGGEGGELTKAVANEKRGSVVILDVPVPTDERECVRSELCVIGSHNLVSIGSEENVGDVHVGYF